MLLFNGSLILILNLVVKCWGEVQYLWIDKLRLDFFQLEDHLWSIVLDRFSEPTQQLETEVIYNFQKFDEKLAKVYILLPTNNSMDPMRNAPQFKHVDSILKLLQAAYETFQKNLYSMNTNISQKFITSNSISAQNLIEDILSMVYKNNNSILNKLHQMQFNSIKCNNINQSAQQVFYNLYNVLFLNHLKTYVLLQFAYLRQFLYNKVLAEGLMESIELREKYQTEVLNQMNHIKDKMETYREIWRCDPHRYQKGVTYDEFTRLLQGHIQNEVDMNRDGRCTKTCSDYYAASSFGCYDNTSDVCKYLQRCTGQIYNCFFVEKNAQVCSKQRQEKRFDLIKFESGKVYGKHYNCINNGVSSWASWFVRCDYCLCLCDQQGALSDRYISLQPVHADVKNNMVVIGLRMVKFNRMVQFQIKEGQLMPFGVVNPDTVHWVKPAMISITDSGIMDVEHYVTLSYSRRTMAMDSLEIAQSNKTEVVTGVQFKTRNGRVFLVIHVSPFNWETGEVYAQQQYSIANIEANRAKIHIKSPDQPVRSLKKSERVAIKDQYVEFSHSDWKKDAAQTTIPYIDIQNVVTEPAVPLAGVGIYYKGNDGFGGFIGPSIKTYDFSKHVHKQFPEIPAKLHPIH